MTRTKAKSTPAMSARAKPAVARKPGAQAGNKNAPRHGFYSRQFRAEEIKRLDEQEPTDVKAEIERLRVMLDRLTDELDFEPVYQPALSFGISLGIRRNWMARFGKLAILTCLSANFRK